MAVEKGKRAAYTLEYKLEAVRLVQGGQACAVRVVARLLPPESANVVLAAKEIGVTVQTLERWREEVPECHLFHRRRPFVQPTLLTA